MHRSNTSLRSFGPRRSIDRGKTEYVFILHSNISKMYSKLTKWYVNQKSYHFVHLFSAVKAGVMKPILLPLDVSHTNGKTAKYEIRLVTTSQNVL